MKKYWKKFFENYRIIEINSDEDLLFQIGRSVNGIPVSREKFEFIINDLLKKINLQENDVVLDLCCGNGVLTYEFAKYCKRVVGVDFSKPYIENAKKYKISDNINYFYGDILDIKETIDFNNFQPDKIIMHASLAYFNGKQLDKLLLMLNNNIKKDFIFLISNVPNRKKRWLYFNTFRRRWDYIFNTIIRSKDRGVGRWWTKKEIVKIVEKNNMKVNFIDIDKNNFAHYYRMDLVIKND